VETGLAGEPVALARSSRRGGRCQIERRGARYADADVPPARPGTGAFGWPGRAHGGQSARRGGRGRARDSFDRQRPAGLRDQVNGAVAGHLDGAAAADADAAVELRSAGASARWRRHLRCDLLFGQTAHTRAGHTDGARRAAARCVEADPDARAEAGSDWSRNWTADGLRVDEMDGNFVVQCAPD